MQYDSSLVQLRVRTKIVDREFDALLTDAVTQAMVQTDPAERARLKTMTKGLQNIRGMGEDSALQVLAAIGILANDLDGTVDGPRS